MMWRKSSRSAGGSGNGNTGDCVEIAFGAEGPMMRDSKAGGQGPRLQINDTAFQALLRSVR